MGQEDGSFLLSEIKQTLALYSFPSLIRKLENVLVDVDADIDTNTNDANSTKLQQLFKTITEQDFRDDLLEHLRQRLLVKIAQEEK